jgi:hypothetical protein
MLNHDESYKLCACALGIAIGVAKGLFLMILAWIAWIWSVGTPLVQYIGLFMHGYAPTLMGGFVGGGWGFLVGFISGLVVGWVYNLCLCCGSSKFCGKICYPKMSNKEK